MMASLADKVAYAILFVVIARNLSQKDFGTYNLILTMLFIGGMIVNFGMESVVIREVAKDKRQAEEFYPNALLLAFMFALCSWAILIGLSHLLHYGPEIVLLMGFGGIILVSIGIGQIASAVIRAHEDMGAYAGVVVCCSSLGLILNLMVLRIWGTVTSLVIVLFLTESVKAAIFTFVVRKYVPALRWKINVSVVGHILKLSVPFALLMAYGALFHRIDLLMMGWLRPLNDVAVYGVAAKFTDVLSLLSGSLIGALYPALSARTGASRHELWDLFSDSLGVFAVCGFGVAGITIVLAEPLLHFLFGGTYATGVVALRWIGWAFLFNMISGPMGTLLLAIGDQMRRLLLLALSLLVVNIALNRLLIPLYGFNGAAATTFMCALAGFLGRMLLSRVYFGKLPALGVLIWRPFLASIVMGVLLFFLMRVHILIVIPAGLSFYIFSLAFLGEFRQARYILIRSR
ncbi:MAG TPA: oligosaccharide flippase family protein, partial [Syntrophorhabdaceae bacterium]|nr:oligosaccharide flippase family protein [Syntrophorhabdaceae bacterium]